jgi:hypothetical protein
VCCNSFPLIDNERLKGLESAHDIITSISHNVFNCSESRSKVRTECVHDDNYPCYSFGCFIYASSQFQIYIIHITSTSKTPVDDSEIDKIWPSSSIILVLMQYSWLASYRCVFINYDRRHNRVHPLSEHEIK